MVTIDEALKIVLGQEVKLHEKEAELGESIGHGLAGDLAAPFDIPTFDNSKVDGYAVCGFKQNYTLVGEVPAGKMPDYELQPGEAMRIFTGAGVPTNTTGIVMQEFMETDGENLILYNPLREGQNIRVKGGQLKEGQVVFERGHTIGPATQGLIGSLGLDKVRVHTKPTISLITTGNELVPPGSELGEGQIYESNSYALGGALTQYGFRLDRSLRIKDDLEATRQGIAEQLEKADVLIVSGGISVGDYDYVRRALEDCGVEEQFYRVFQKPGKPLYFGRRGDTFVFALPGNPASSLTCFYIYVLPFLRKLSGMKQMELPRFFFPSVQECENRLDRPAFLKAQVENGLATILDGQGSSMLWSMAMGNALVYLKEQSKVEAGESVQCILL